MFLAETPSCLLCQTNLTLQLVDQVYTACDELLNSQMLVLVLEYILAIGNYLNRNWSEQNVTAGFQVTSLDKVNITINTCFRKYMNQEKDDNRILDTRNMWSTKR